MKDFSSIKNLNINFQMTGLQTIFLFGTIYLKKKKLEEKNNILEIGSSRGNVSIIPIGIF